MKHLALLTVTLFILTSCSLKKSDTTVPTRMAEEFFVTYKAKGPTAALEALLPTNPYISKAVADSVSAQVERLTKGMGNYEGFEKVAESSYGEGIFMLTYIVKYSRQPLRFNFKFYKPGDVWKLHYFTYESEFLNEMDEMARPYRLKEGVEP